MLMVKISTVALIAGLGFAAPALAQTAAVPVTPAPAGANVVIAAPEGYVFTEVASVTASELKGVDIYDAEGKDVGEIADIKLGADNALQSVLTDVGGFLGMGEHRVALTPAQIHIYKNADNDMRAYVTLTKDELKALPAFKE